jgi:glyoxylase-like metal-dependent hydrolase (beta-lactamase superfamily II)
MNTGAHPINPEYDNMIIESKGKIADGLFAVGAPELPAFLLTGTTPALFDAGMTVMGPLYLKDLKALLGDQTPLSYIFLTHAHFDHSGACPYLKRNIRGLQVGAHPLAAETFRKPNAIELIRSLSRDYEDRHAAQTGKEDISFDALQVDVLLEDGMDFDLGGGLGFRVVATPGHTRDSISFYIPKLKALITGEAIGVYDRNMTIHPEFLASYHDYLASLEKLACLETELLLLGHYFTLTGEDARTYIAKSIARTKIFRKRIEACLHDLHGDREAVVKRIFREDYEETGAILQEARPYLINLAAKVKAVAEGK